MASSSGNDSGGGGGISKWLLLGLGVFVFMQFVWPKIHGSSASDRQPLTLDDATASDKRTDEKLCELTGDRFSAKLSTRGGSLRSMRMTDAKYAKHVDEPQTRTDLVSTTVESRMPLRTDFRDPSVQGEQQFGYDDVDYELTASDAKSCTFVYKDEKTEVTKLVSLTGRPFELDVKLTVKNLADKPLKHRLAIEQTSWRTQSEISGHFGRMPEFDTEVVLHSKTKTGRHHPDSFEPKDFADKEFTSEKWLRQEGEGVWAATSSSYFSSAVIHQAGPTPFAEGQIEDRWDAARYPKKEDDPGFGHVYRSRLAYPTTELAKGESSTYEVLSFMGPKERDVVTSIGGGAPDRYETGSLVNMSVFLFGNLFSSTLGKLLVGYVYWLHGAVGSWGFAIVLLTITVKLGVFPLSLFGLKNMIGMRRIKPQMDDIAKQYKDNMMERNVATQELMRREKVGSPMAGCLPALLQMPVWLTLYAALRTAVELYHTPFGPLIPDLSEPGRYFVIPIVLGASSFLQQKLMQANMPSADPQQAKMMLYMMPAVFTVMNVFLPAGLGVYMLTNTWLGIIQQTLTERWIQKKLKEQGASSIEVREKPGPLLTAKTASSNAASPSAAALGKGKARARG